MNRLPRWLKQELPGSSAGNLERNIHELGVDTVCRQAKCPNINYCFSRNQATFMILGDSCTRNCRFCNVNSAGDGPALNGRRNRNAPNNEPQRIAEAVRVMGLEYVVITSVTRDDLVDGGASRFVKVIESIRALDKDIQIEVLIPDLQGDIESLSQIIKARPFVLAHNLETIKRLYGAVRPGADYDRSLGLLRAVKGLSRGQLTKSSLILGLGEKEIEVVAALRELRESGCDIVTLGQYLAPSPRHFPVKEFISPEQFRKFQDIAMDLGFRRVLSGPRVRSSYQAQELTGDLTYA